MKRASGTFWERQLFSNWIVIIPLAYFLGVHRFDSYLIGLGLCIFVLLVYSLIDLFTYTRFELQPVHCWHGALHVGKMVVQPEQITSLRVFHLSATKNSWDFVEVQYRAEETEVRALCQSKHIWIFFIGRENPTIRIILEHFPMLKAKVLEEYRADGYKEIRDPSLRRPDPPPVEIAEPSPTARYRDPYFQRRRR